MRALRGCRAGSASAGCRDLAESCGPRTRGRSEQGFTLVELLIVVTVMPLIIGALAAGLLAVFSQQNSVASRLSGSQSNQIVSATFTKDVQGATYISTLASPACGPTGAGYTQLVALEWNARQSVVSYVTVQSGSVTALVRQYCAAGESATATSATTISSSVTPATTTLLVCATSVSTCAAASPQTWTTALAIAMNITALQLNVDEAADAYTYSLTAVPVLSRSTTDNLGSPTTGPVCGFALPGTGTYASTLCFIGFSSSIIAAAELNGGTSMSVAVPGGYTITFNLTIVASRGVVGAAPFPTYSAAFLGNDIGGLPFYTGVGCPYTTSPITNQVPPQGTPSCINPAIYQTSSGAVSTITLSNIVVTTPQGQPATGYEVVTADAETTDPGESIVWNSNVAMSLIPNTPSSAEGNACNLQDSNGNPLAGGTDLTFSPDSKTVTCQSTWQSPANQPRTGTAMLGISPPTVNGVTTPVTVSAQITGAGLEGVAFGSSESSSAIHRRLASANTLLTTINQDVISISQKKASTIFAADPTATYQADLTALLPTGYTATILSVKYWDASATPPAFSTTFVAGAPQLVTFTVHNATGQSYTNSVVVDDPLTPTLATSLGVAAQLVFSSSPSGATLGQAFVNQPVVNVEDATGKLVTSNLSPVTLSILSGTGAPGATLSGCTGLETSGVITWSGCSIDTLGLGYQIVASLPGVASGYSAPFDVTPIQLLPPGISAVAPSTTTAGALKVTFTNSSNAASGQTYTAIACTDSQMSTGCVSQSNYTSGAQLTGLTQGTSYYVQIVADASTGYLAATSPPGGPAPATVQLAAPSGVALDYGLSVGSINVSFSAPFNAASPQTYTVKLCTNSAMSSGCVTKASFVSGSDATGLAYGVGSAGTTYWVTVTADASTGYLVSPATAASSHADTSQVAAPGRPTVASSTTTEGAVTATFTASSGVPPSSYVALACTDAAMTLNCVTATGYVSGAQLPGLSRGVSYYVQITAIGPTGCLSTPNFTSGAQMTNLVPGSAYYVAVLADASTGSLPAQSSSVGPTLATVQLATPTGVSVNYGATPGSINVTFTAPSNAAPGQTYTMKACTNSAMTTGCITRATFVSGSDVTVDSLYTAGNTTVLYWVTITANASTGYLVSATTTPVSHLDYGQVAAPGPATVVTGSGGTGRLKVTFTASSGVAPASYTVVACTNFSMTSGCVTATNFTSGNQITGLTSGTFYYVQVTAVGPAGYLSTKGSVTATSVKAS